MCNAQGLRFAEKALTEKEVAGKKIIEVGSANVNGSVRPYIESLKPRVYLGVDISKGKGVDFISTAENLLTHFKKETFDVLISTELMEHVLDWRKAISNFKKLVKPGGVLLITTRSFGFPYHGYPFDFWRYEVQDMQNIFSDCIIETLEKDPSKGVFVKVVKPMNFEENDLYDIELYSVITDKRVKNLSDIDIFEFTQRNRRHQFFQNLRPLNFIHLMRNFVISKLS